MDALGSKDHGVKPVEPVEQKLDPLEPLSDEQKDKAIQDWVAENGF